jgi:hypothetical protein
MEKNYKPVFSMFFFKLFFRLSMDQISKMHLFYRAEPKIEKVPKLNGVVYTAKLDINNMEKIPDQYERIEKIFQHILESAREEAAAELGDHPESFSITVDSAGFDYTDPNKGTLWLRQRDFIPDAHKVVSNIFRHIDQNSTHALNMANTPLQIRVDLFRHAFKPRTGGIHGGYNVGDFLDNEAEASGSDDDDSDMPDEYENNSFMDDEEVENDPPQFQLTDEEDNGFPNDVQMEDICQQNVHDPPSQAEDEEFLLGKISDDHLCLFRSFFIGLCRAEQKILEVDGPGKRYNKMNWKFFIDSQFIKPSNAEKWDVIRSVGKGGLDLPVKQYRHGLDVDKELENLRSLLKDPREISIQTIFSNLF